MGNYQLVSQNAGAVIPLTPTVIMEGTDKTALEDEGKKRRKSDDDSGKYYMVYWVRAAQ